MFTKTALNNIWKEKLKEFNISFNCLVHFLHLSPLKFHNYQKLKKWQSITSILSLYSQYRSTHNSCEKCSLSMLWSVCVCVCVCERESMCVCEREKECVCFSVCSYQVVCFSSERFIASQYINGKYCNHLVSGCILLLAIRVLIEFCFVFYLDDLYLCYNSIRIEMII